MSGHSKWASIKRQKGVNDAKRGQLFTKLGREIAIASREGGPDPEMNFRLRLVLDKAKQANMPKENIDRAIRRGAGDGDDGAQMEEQIYEGYGPHGTAIILEAVTDNRNRTVSEVRHAFSRYGGNLGSDGSVAWMFSHKGVITVAPGKNDPDEVALVAIDAGAEDVELEDDGITVYTERSDFRAVQEALMELGCEVSDAQLSWIPQSQVTLADNEAMTILKLMEALEDLDDVQEVYSNLDMNDELLAKLESEAA
ncbi:MAG: YebC/PmpR family DNA-binding transcriptional regulator [Anaerolineae bacterium]|jgi:YebC/PmpR family DNA-binding regulatory protein|nr:YebC/PmpR family DNA-binding transcriptional regulator [Chloroflexota bacterium]